MAGLEPEYEQAFNAWKTTPSKQTSGALLKAVDPIITTAIRSFGGGAAGSPTLRTKAKQLAIQDGFPSYDPQRGTLKTHLLSRLQRLQRLAGQEQHVMAMPERVALDQWHTVQAGKDLEDRLGRPPSDQELADASGISLRRLTYIRQGRPAVSESAAARHTTDTQGGYDPAVQHNNADAWLEFVHADLSPTDQFIMERGLGMHGHATTPPTSIAQQLRLSPAAISKRMLKIQQLIDSQDELGGL